MNDLSQSGRSATISPELREGNGDEDPAQAASSEHSAAAIANAVAALIHADHFMQTMVRLTPTFNASYRQTRVRHLLTTAVGAACTTANFLKKIERGECTDISPDEQDNLEHQLIALSNEVTALCDQMQQSAARYNPVAGSIERVHDAAIRMLQQTCDFIDRSTVPARAATPPVVVSPEPSAIEAYIAWIRHRQC